MTVGQGAGTSQRLDSRFDRSERGVRSMVQRA
jgi:hypothetical protein